MVFQPRHGYAKTKTYEVWKAMKYRCNNPKQQAYKNYGARGITVCKRWHTFSNFAIDMGTRPKGKSIDRIDNSKGYSPKNCRWATPKEQAANRRVTIFVTIDGKRKTMVDWANEYGVAYIGAYTKYKKGFKGAEIFTGPTRTAFIEFNGKTKTISEWSRDTGIKHWTIWWRHQAGFPPEDIFFKGRLACRKRD